MTTPDPSSSIVRAGAAASSVAAPAAEQDQAAPAAEHGLPASAPEQNAELGGPEHVVAEHQASPYYVPADGPFPTALASQAVCIFALLGASVGLFVGTVSRMSKAAFGSFLDVNDVGQELRLRLFFFLIGGAVLGALPALGALLWKRRRAVAGLRQLAEIVLPLCLIGLWRSLFSAQPWHDKPLTYMVGLSIVVLVLERALRRSFRAWPRSFGSWHRSASVAAWLRAKCTPRPGIARWLPLVVVLLGSSAYAIYFSYYTILNHQRLQTMGFDLGINVNWAYNALHGHITRNTVVAGAGVTNYFGVHAVFAMLTWVPFFAIHPSSEFFLIFQSLAAGFAGTTLYLFAATQMPRWSAVLVAFAYLLYAPLHGPNFYDFHELMPPLFFHFLLYWAIARRKTWLVFLLVPLIWTYREDLTIGLAVLGFFLVVTGVRPKAGFWIALSSTIWFVVVKLVIMPSLWSGWFDTIYSGLQAGQRGYGTVLVTILSNPLYFLSTLLVTEKLVYFLHMFAPLAFLAARRWSLLMLALPGFAFSLLTTGYPPTVSIAFQYTCHAIPYVFCASVLMLGIISRAEGGAIRRRAVLGAVALGMASHSFVFGAVLQHETFVGGFRKIEFAMSSKDTKRYATLKRLVALIPQEASVAATETEVPHIAARLNAYTLKDGPADADYILINGQRMGMGNVRAALNTMLGRDQYGLVGMGHDIYLFKRGLVAQETKGALKRLGLKR
jgi:uncharacterized membrane protein